MSLNIRGKPFINWIKGSLALVFAKDGLINFMIDEITVFKDDLIESVCKDKGIPPGSTCSSCSTQNLLRCPTKNVCSGKEGQCSFHNNSNDPSKKSEQPCPNNMCVDIKRGIKKQHRYGQPSFKNTDATRWCYDALQIAKCYMPPGGYSSKNTLEELDFNAVISVILNNERFGEKMKADLSHRNTCNICEEARTVSNKIRHSGNISITDTELNEYLDILQELLSDDKYLCNDPEAQAAKKKINELKSGTLVVSRCFIIETLEDQIGFEETSTDKTGAATDNRRTLEGAKNYLAACSKDGDINIGEMFTDYASQLKELGETVAKNIQEIGRKETEKVKRKMSQEHSQTVSKRKIGSSVQELKEDIIEFYKNKKSAIPIAPLIENKDVPLINFYVQPNLCRTFTNRYLITGKNQRKQQSDLCNQNVNIESPSKNPIKSYKELFLRDGKETHKRIYITAKAGYGKTSFAQSVCMTWCQAHSPDDEFRAKFKDRDKDLETMKGFELLFFISLKCTTEQDVDDMIHNQIISQLSRRLKYGREELEDILNTEKHLIILDGLDEWSLKGAYQIGDPAAIGRIDRKTSTFLTTTRAWKMSDIKQSEIDIQIEIDRLDDESSDILLRNAVSVLPGETRDIVDFKEKFPSERLGVLRYIPYILLQLICLWYDKRHAGTSRCEIYSSAIELTFQRGLQKVKESITEKKTNSGKIPKRFCKFCPTLQDYFGLVLPLGRVAFTDT